MESAGRFVVPTKRGRFVAYGLTGWCAEVLFTGIHDFIRTHDTRLASRSSLWMFGVYGLMQPMFEPLHDPCAGGCRRRCEARSTRLAS
jgi:hypothetical protein